MRSEVKAWVLAFLTVLVCAAVGRAGDSCRCTLTPFGCHCENPKSGCDDYRDCPVYTTLSPIQRAIAEARAKRRQPPANVPVPQAQRYPGVRYFRSAGGCSSG